VRDDYTSVGALEGRRWLLADERGSIYAHADEAGAIIQIHTYDEYGRPGNSNQGRFGYGLPLVSVLAPAALRA
jgi:hypothetical protein